jgi:hypothetical protein
METVPPKKKRKVGADDDNYNNATDPVISPPVDKTAVLIVYKIENPVRSNNAIVIVFSF